MVAFKSVVAIFIKFISIHITAMFSIKVCGEQGVMSLMCNINCISSVLSAWFNPALIQKSQLFFNLILCVLWPAVTNNNLPAKGQSSTLPLLVGIALCVENFSENCLKTLKLISWKFIRKEVISTQIHWGSCPKVFYEVYN